MEPIRRGIAVVVGVAALGVVALLLRSHFPSESHIFNTTADGIAKIEGRDHLSPVVAVDLALVLQLSAFVFGSLGLIFLTQLFAKFVASAISLIMNKRYTPVRVSEALPPMRWLALPFLGLLVSLACTRIYPSA